MPYKITVPEDAYEGLEKLIALSNADFQSLLNAINETVPTFQLDEFSTQVSAKVSFDPEIANEIIEFILPLYAVRFDMGVTTSQFIDLIIDAVNQISREELDIPDDITSLGGRIGELLELNQTLGVVSKSRFISSQHERLFIDTRIFTELRPIFQDNPEVLPSAGIIIHKLKINYFEGGRVREFFIAMDSTDIEKLRKALNRADYKAESLRSLMDTTSMQILEIKSNEE